MTILRDTFYPRLCHERIELKDGVIKAYFPMVSFCDIPLSQVKEHIRYYGEYGLGMSRSWAERKGLNPVMYIRKGSRLSAHIQALPKILRAEPGPKRTAADIQDTAVSILQYAKAFEGTWLKGKSTGRRIKFYNEREIRYVPPARSAGFYFLTEKEHQDEDRREKAKSVLEKFPLSFEPDDIKYIIISKDSERVEMARAVWETRSRPNYTDDIRMELITKIISCEQIKEDF